MSKRLTEVGKWSDNWFMNLKPEHKLAWMYLCDSCDIAGVWDPNHRLADCQIGVEIDWDDFLRVCGKRVTRLSSGKLWIVHFVEFQQNSGRLNSHNRAHLGIIRALESAGIPWRDFGYEIDVSPELPTKTPSPLEAPSKPLASPTSKSKSKSTSNSLSKSSNTLGTPNRIDTQYGLDSESKPKDLGASNTEHEKEVDSEPDRFGIGNFDVLGIDGSTNPKIDEKAVQASRNERKGPDPCPISTEPTQHAPESILRVQKKTPEIIPASKPGKLDGPAKILFGDRVQTVILPNGLDTRRVERAVQRWVDYCQSMGKLPQVMALENQLLEVARANPKEDDFVHAISRTIANNCDPHNFKPRLWAREWVGTAARPQPEREPDKVYNTLEQCRAAGAI